MAIKISDEDLQEISPYQGEVYQKTIQKLAHHPAIETVKEKFFPGANLSELQKKLSQVQTVEDFQKDWIRPIIDQILKLNSDILSFSGVQKLDPSKTYLFISNHRNILMDPGLIAYALHVNGIPTPHVCLGDNLIQEKWIEGLVKLNRGVVVKRNLSQRELLRWSMTLSTFINEQVGKNLNSVWIAQQEGRAKNGIDRTHTGVLKMIALGKKKSPAQIFQELHLVPVSLSYEFEPCAMLFARELYLKEQEGSYQKKPQEDHLSMSLGMFGKKGRIHLGFHPFEGKDFKELEKEPNKSLQFNLLAQKIDRKIKENMKIWPSAYVAKDLLEEKVNHSERYTHQDHRHFLEIQKMLLEKLNDPGLPEKEIKKRYLEYFARPLLS